MHFDTVMGWVGINEAEADKYLPNELANMKVVDRGMVGNIVRYKATNFNMVVVRFPQTHGNGWLSNWGLRATVKNKVPSYAEKYTLALHGNGVLYVVEFDDISMYKTKEYETEFSEFAKNVLNVTSGIIFDEVDSVLDNIEDLSLYIPMHDGIPACWVDWVGDSTPESIYHVESQGLRIENFKSWFNEHTHQTDMAVIPLMLSYKDVNVKFYFNKKYQRYNGSLTYEKIFMPVLAKFIHECVNKQYLDHTAIDNWIVWIYTNGTADTDLFPSLSKKEEALDSGIELDVPEVEQKTNVGEWVFEFTTNDTSDKGYVSLQDAASVIARKATAKDDSIEISAIRSNGEVSVYIFEPAPGVNIFGHIYEIAEALKERLTKDDFGDNTHIK